MCRIASRELDGSIAMVAEARAFVAATLRRWDLEALVMDAELLTSELVTNSVLHARSDVSVSVSVANATAEIGVTDDSSDAPTPRWAASGAEGGRGLRLVERVAAEWGVAYVGAGKQVWCRLGVGTDWAYGSTCPCCDDGVDRVRLESGRWAVASPGPWDAVD
jgi:anti-sigma regulatory factor (Ser/Thr protein kinase)